MKKLIPTVFALLLLLASCANDDEGTPQAKCDFVNFKYYKGEVDHLGELQKNYILIGVDTTYADDQVQQFTATVEEVDQNYEYVIRRSERYKFKEIPVRLKSSMTCEGITRIISELEQNSLISYAHYTMQTDNCENLIWEQIGEVCINSYSSNFYVKVMDENELSDFHKVIKETHTELIKENQLMPGLFHLQATKASKGDALKMANYFQETGLFEYAEPEITKYPVE